MSCHHPQLSAAVNNQISRRTQELLLLRLWSNNLRHGIAPFQFAYFSILMLKLSSLMENMQSILAYFAELI